MYKREIILFQVLRKLNVHKNNGWPVDILDVQTKIGGEIVMRDPLHLI